MLCCQVHSYNKQAYHLVQKWYRLLLAIAAVVRLEGVTVETPSAIQIHTII